MNLDLDARERTMLAGAEGKSMQLAMRLVVKAAEIMGARRLIPISFAHLDACFYTGQAHVDFARFLLDHGARLAVPAWTNNGLVSLADPQLRPEAADPETVAGARNLMTLYAQLGCKPTWSCAPYQLPGGPNFGDHIAVGESNAVAYYNSVIGARTNKYGDYLDVACALVGKVPHAGLHTDEGRKAAIHFDCTTLPGEWQNDEIFHHLLGHHVGRVAGRRVTVISGLVRTAPANLKALSAASAASGGVELWHGIGITPEAPHLDAVFGDGESVSVGADNLRQAHADLTSGGDGPLDGVALGTPHFSLSQFEELMRLLGGRRVHSGLVMLVTTARTIRSLIEASGLLAALERAGVAVPVDVCTYYSPRVRGLKGRVMTNAAKWAYYAPGMLGLEVCFGSLRECIESAVRGEVWRDPQLWMRQ